jgi:hypothetical protein
MVMMWQRSNLLHSTTLFIAQGLSMLKLPLAVLLMLLGTAPTNLLAAPEQALVKEELDASAREQQELESRIQELEQQQQASQAIAEKQQQLIDALEQQIKAYQAQDKQP